MAGGGWAPRFWAVVRYELLWNIRKKKLIGVLVLALLLATLALVLPVVLSNVTGLELARNPNYVVDTGIGVGGLGMFLFAVAVAMNSISGEFEGGTAVTLLTKPVSRTTIFLGKLTAALITLGSAYALLLAYMAVGGTIVYGPQENLHLLPLSLLGATLSTLMWMSIVLAVGSISKSSLLAALGSFGVFMALAVGSPIISMASDQAWILSYLPGGGATGYLAGAGGGTPYTLGAAVSTGTDGIAANLVRYALNPSLNVTFFKVANRMQVVELYSEPLSAVLARSILVASAYSAVLLAAAWYTFRRAEVLD
ncbi:MAG: ABC transporter permease [Candidatus Nezhaarchaeota archaeon]|nr:ABC transporter permease [Candidatus Nezhaarchaeota archaeon]